MTKKLTALFLALVLCLSLCTVTAFAVVIVGSGTIGDKWQIGKTAGTDNVTAYLDGTTLHIQGTGAMMNCANNGDNQPWLNNRASITSLIIESGVTSIGFNAFSGCTSLASVIIPNSVTSIEASAFDGCTSLASVTTLASVTNIGNYAFQNTGLTSVTILADVTYGSQVYKACTALTNVTIDSGVTEIKANTFTNCTALTNVTIPNSVTSIGNFAFQNTALTSVIIPDSVTSIGGYAFANSNLTTVTIPASVTSIGQYAFNGCASLTNVMVMKATTPLTALGNVDAFGGCNSNLKIYVPAGSVDEYKETNNWSSYQDKIFPVYDLTIASMEHGTVAANYASAASGTDVTLTVTPDNGYKLTSLTVTKQSGTTVTVTGNKFTMPNENVTVTAVFEKKAIADIIATYENFPLTEDEDLYWTNDKGTACYYFNNILYFRYTSDKSLKQSMTVSVAADGKNYTYSGDTATYTFIMDNSGVLAAITVSGSTDIKYNGTYGAPPTKYTVTNGTTGMNGNIAIDKASAAEGETVTITVTPDEGYELKADSLKVYKKNTVVKGGPQALPITPTQDAQDKTKYTFTMPAYAVTVMAVFEEKSGTGGGNHHHGGGTATVQSAKTADMGVALYGVLSVSSLLGMGWVSKKKH